MHAYTTWCVLHRQFFFSEICSSIPEFLIKLLQTRSVVGNNTIVVISAVRQPIQGELCWFFASNDVPSSPPPLSLSLALPACCKTYPSTKCGSTWWKAAIKKRSPTSFGCLYRFVCGRWFYRKKKKDEEGVEGGGGGGHCQCKVKVIHGAPAGIILWSTGYHSSLHVIESVGNLPLPGCQFYFCAGSLKKHCNRRNLRAHKNSMHYRLRNSVHHKFLYSKNVCGDTYQLTCIWVYNFRFY